MFSTTLNRSPEGPIQRYMAQGILDRVFPGAVVWAATGDAPPRTWSVGHLSHLTGSPVVTADTLFDLASLTKPMASTTLCMALADDGTLHWDDPLGKHIPAFLEGPEPALRQQVTLRHLLTHSSGLPAYRPFYQRLDNPVPSGDGARASIVAMICQEPMERPPGEKSVYSDLGFILLGEVLQRATNTDLAQLFADKVATPLGLEHAAFNPGNRPEQFLPSPAATLDCPRRHTLLCGQVHDDNAHSMGGVAGHAGLFATAAEVGHWAQALIAAYHGQEGWLRPATVRTFLDAAPAAPDSSWVMGFDTPTSPSSAGSGFGAGSVGHLGYTGTSVWMDMAKKWVVVLLSNRICPDDAGLEKIRRFRPGLHDSVVRHFLAGSAPYPEQ
jgi:CubicO group peptidase (beta-lactamase class C family)